MTEASDVALSSEMVLLPSAGTMARSACGSTIRRRVSTGDMPSECAATTWLGPTDRMPPRMISPEKAASLRANPMTAVQKDESGTPIAGNIT